MAEFMYELGTPPCKIELVNAAPFFDYLKGATVDCEESRYCLQPFAPNFASSYSPEDGRGAESNG